MRVAQSGKRQARPGGEIFLSFPGWSAPRVTFPAGGWGGDWVQVGRISGGALARLTVLSCPEGVAPPVRLEPVSL